MDDQIKEEALYFHENNKGKKVLQANSIIVISVKNLYV